MIKHACIKNGVVDNVLIFDAYNEELFNKVMEDYGYDAIVECPEEVCVGYNYVDSNFVSNLNYVSVPNVLGMSVTEAETLLQGLSLEVQVGEASAPAISSISVKSNKLTIETIEKHFCAVGDSVTVSLLENEDLNGTYSVVSVSDENTFVVDKNIGNISKTYVPNGRIVSSSHSGKVFYQSPNENDLDVVENSVISIVPFIAQ